MTAGVFWVPHSLGYSTCCILGSTMLWISQAVASRSRHLRAQGNERAQRHRVRKSSACDRAVLGHSSRTKDGLQDAQVKSLLRVANPQSSIRQSHIFVA